MATHKLLWISTLTFAFGLNAAGCAKDDDGDSGTNTNGEDSGSESGTASSTMSGSSTNASMSVGETSDSMSSSMTEPSTITVTDGSTGDEEPKENGATCDANEECVSTFCFVVGVFGGICGDCNSDADCTETGGGCSIPNPLSQPPEGATCNMGEAGGGCMSNDVCMDGLQCAEILNVPGVLVASTCSECIADADCGEDLCSPTYDVLGLSGQKSCVEVGSVPNGEGCDLEGTGDMACNSTHCASADVMSLLELGVCSECELDEKGASIGCAKDEVCEPAAVDLTTGLVAATCVVPE